MFFSSGGKEKYWRLDALRNDAHKSESAIYFNNCSDKEIFKVEVFGKNSTILINASIRILSINAQDFTLYISAW